MYVYVYRDVLLLRRLFQGMYGKREMLFSNGWQPLDTWETVAGKKTGL